MKKVLFPLAALTAIAVSCAKVEEPAAPVEPAADGVGFALKVSPTKTVADGYSTKWVAGDEINIFNAPKDGDFAAQGAFTIDETGLADGTFTGTITPLKAESYSWIAAYPYTETNTDLAALAFNVGGATATFATAPALAGANVPLIGAVADVAKDDAVAITMKQLASAIKLDVKNGNSAEFAVSEIALTFPVAVAGAFTVNATDLDAITYTASESATKTITFSAGTAVTIAAGETVSFYAPIAPVTIAKDAKIAYTINGEAGEITAAADLIFMAGKVKPISVNVPEIVLPTDLSENGTANCYIVSEAGEYTINATVKGNGAKGIHETFAAAGADTDPVIEPTGARLLWEEGGLVSDVMYDNGKIFFNASGKFGNAVIAATDASGNILWSWHIWCTTAPTEIELLETSGEKKTHYYLNKNLGAKDANDPGTYYQWGRKDPFSTKIGFAEQGTDSEAGHHGCFYQQSKIPADLIAAGYNTVQYATANPMRYIGASVKSGNNDWFAQSSLFRWRWGLSHKDIGDAGGNANCSFSPFGKTIYDPCPAGYMVATPTSWANGGGWKKVDGGIETYQGSLFVPNSGFIYNCGGGFYGSVADGSYNWAGLWSCSSSWGNVNNGFRLQDTADSRSNYDPATGHPVRCERLNK